MPFKSEAQKKFLYVNHPEIAERWSKHTSDNAKLPERVSQAPRKKQKRVADIYKGY